LIVTAQSATRVYGPGRSSSETRWYVAEGATLELRSEPLLLFAGADYRAETSIVLAAGSRLLAFEVTGLAEPFDACAHLTTVVRRNSKLGLRDALTLDRRTLAGHAVGSLVAYGYDVCVPNDVEETKIGLGSTLDGGTFLRVMSPKIWSVKAVLERAAVRETAQPEILRGQLGV